jgi:hypothetical protein
MALKYLKVLDYYPFYSYKFIFVYFGRKIVHKMGMNICP